MLPVNRDELNRRYKAALADLAGGRVSRAEEALRSLAKIAPKSPEIWFQLSRIADHNGDHPAALAHLEQALALKPDEPALLNAAISKYGAVGAEDKALAAYDRLIAAQPKAIKPRADKALYLQSCGRFDEAEKIFRFLLKRLPENGELYRMFVATKKIKPGDPLIAAMKKAWSNKALPDEQRFELGFALGKAMEDIGKTDQVFPYLRRANDLQRKAYPYAPEARDQEVKEALANQRGPLTPVSEQIGPRPIFVTGMPRSGTTLVEQILAAHSDVTAGGEMALALKLVYQKFGSAMVDKPLDRLSNKELLDFASSLQTQASAALGAETPAYTDKSIQNHLVLGLLYRAMPHARFIVVHRDPRDVAVSIYKNHFRNGTHRYSNDLRDIARYIKSFRRAVDHWRERLPDRFHELNYEDLVANPEDEALKLLAAAGLDWEDQIMDFHKAGGTVKTLSLHQVRQPIYTSQAQAWRRYEKELAPFIAEWETD